MNITDEELTTLVRKYPEEQLRSLGAQRLEWLTSSKAYYLESECRVIHYQERRGEEDKYKVLKGSED